MINESEEERYFPLTWKAWNILGLLMHGKVEITEWSKMNPVPQYTDAEYKKLKAKLDARVKRVQILTDELDSSRSESERLSSKIANLMIDVLFDGRCSECGQLLDGSDERVKLRSELERLKKEIESKKEYIGQLQRGYWK